MPIAVVLAALTGESSDSSVLESARAIASRSGARIRALFVRRDPTDVLLITSPDGMMISPEIIAIAEQGNVRAAKRAHDHFETWRAGAGREASSEWAERAGALRSIFASEGQLADLVVTASLAAGRSDRASESLETALFETGRPVLIVPKHAPADLLSHPMIAWKASPECARAVAAALPLLGHADRVEVFSLDERTGKAAPPVQLIEYLAAHRIEAHAVSFDAAAAIGPTLLKEAARHQATLLVLGGYGHSRVRELVFGGVTQHVLDHAAIPVLMTH